MVVPADRTSSATACTPNTNAVSRTRGVRNATTPPMRRKVTLASATHSTAASAVDLSMSSLTRLKRWMRPPTCAVMPRMYASTSALKKRLWIASA